MSERKPSVRQLALLRRIQKDGGRVAWKSYGSEFHPFTWGALWDQGWVDREKTQSPKGYEVPGVAFLTDKAIAYLWATHAEIKRDAPAT